MHLIHTPLAGEPNGSSHSSIPVWRTPRAEEPGGLQFMGSHRVRHDWVIKPPPPPCTPVFMAALLKIARSGSCLNVHGHIKMCVCVCVCVCMCVFVCIGFPGGADGKESTYSAGDLGSIPGSERSLGGGHSNPLQYSCLKNPTDRGAWRATVHGVAKSWMDMTEWAWTNLIVMYFRCGDGSFLSESLFSLVKCSSIIFWTISLIQLSSFCLKPVSDIFWCVCIYLPCFSIFFHSF